MICINSVFKSQQKILHGFFLILINGSVVCKLMLLLAIDALLGFGLKAFDNKIWTVIMDKSTI